MQIFDVIIFFKLRTIQQKTVKPSYLCPLDARNAGSQLCFRFFFLQTTVVTSKIIRRAVSAWRPRSTLGHDRATVGTYSETRSRATCQGTFGHSRLRSLSHCGLILAKKKEKKSGVSVRELHSTSRKKKKKSAGGE